MKAALAADAAAHTTASLERRPLMSPSWEQEEPHAVAQQRGNHSIAAGQLQQLQHRARKACQEGTHPSHWQRGAARRSATAAPVWHLAARFRRAPPALHMQAKRVSTACRRGKHSVTCTIGQALPSQCLRQQGYTTASPCCRIVVNLHIRGWGLQMLFNASPLSNAGHRGQRRAWARSHRISVDGV